MSALSVMARGILAAGLFLSGPIPLAIAHTDLELQIAELSRQLADAPDNAALLIKRGDLYRRHEEYGAAAQDFAAARKANPDDPRIDFHEGRLALETGDAQRARELLNQYLALAPGNGAAWVLLGQAELNLKQPLDAAQSFSRAIDLSARPSPQLFRLQVLALVAERRLETAREAVDEALAIWPHQVNLIGLATDVSLAQNDPAQAEAYLRRLPDGLSKVDRWRQRAEWTACLSDPNRSDQTDCLAGARQSLAQQVNELTP